jgi:hypothetical protein
MIKLRTATLWTLIGIIFVIIGASFQLGKYLGHNSCIIELNECKRENSEFKSILNSHQNIEEENCQNLLNFFLNAKTSHPVWLYSDAVEIFCEGWKNDGYDVTGPVCIQMLNGETIIRYTIQRYDLTDGLKYYDWKINASTNKIVAASTLSNRFENYLSTGSYK